MHLRVTDICSFTASTCQRTNKQGCCSKKGFFLLQELVSSKLAFTSAIGSCNWLAYTAFNATILPIKKIKKEKSHDKYLFDSSRRNDRNRPPAALLDGADGCVLEHHRRHRFRGRLSSCRGRGQSRGRGVFALGPTTPAAGAWSGRSFGSLRAGASSCSSTPLTARVFPGADAVDAGLFLQTLA